MSGLELRCHRQFHGRQPGPGIAEVYCRRCSQAASATTVRRLIFHRWDVTGPEPVPLEDRTDTQPR